MHNPLIAAVDAYDWLAELECEMMGEVAGQAAFDPWDETLSNDVANLVFNAAPAVADLSPRARDARLNLIWRDFVAQQRKLREAPHVPKIEF